MSTAWSRGVLSQYPAGALRPPCALASTERTDVDWQNKCHSVVLCSCSASLELYLLCTDAPHIYRSIFIATPQHNDYVFVSYACQQYLMRLQRAKMLMCVTWDFTKPFFMNTSGWQASSCDRRLFFYIRHLQRIDWLVGWICAVALPVTSKTPRGKNSWKGSIVFT